MIWAEQVRAASKRYKKMAPVLDEQSRRRFVALEAQYLGRGGVSLMARITGLARRTIYRGLDDIRNNRSADPPRVRKKGGGRKKKILEDTTFLPDLKRLVEATAVATRYGRSCGRAEAYVTLLENRPPKGTRFLLRLSGTYCGRWGTVSRQTARRKKASNNRPGCPIPLHQ